MADEAPQTFKRDKGFGRLIVDLAGKKLPVKLHLQTGAIVEGKLLNIESDVLAVLVEQDRFNADYLYVPLAAVVGIAISKNHHQ